MHLFAHQRRVHFMMRQARLRFEATCGPLQRAERRRAIRHGGGRSELPRRRHCLAKVSEMLRNKLERDLTRKKGRQSERAGSLEGEEEELAGQGHRKEVYLIYDRPHKLGTRTHVCVRPKVMPAPIPSGRTPGPPIPIMHHAVQSRHNERLL